jgi:2-dehydro-3-deoxy-D-arabinonate dehydratase
MEESQDSGGDSFYDRVYNADRPELFFKGNASTVVGPREKVRLRSDSQWIVPEPELTLAINRRGKIVGYTVGNDMSCRDIEGENPLYLPQAKVFNGSCALGPGILLAEGGLDPDTRIILEITRSGNEVFHGQISIKEIKRPLASLVEWLWRDNDFPSGCFLMTGTGIVPPDAFSLKSRDIITITIPPVGTLTNEVA